MIRRLIILLLIVGCEEAPTEVALASFAGCTLEDAPNYDSIKTIPCTTDCINDQTGSNCCCEEIIYGCMDENAANFSELANAPCVELVIGIETPNACCIESIAGCMDISACNHAPNANEDDGSCEYATDIYDCDGNCAVEIDECGVCDGNGSILTIMNDVEWTLDQYTLSNTSLTATGMITNTRDSTILAPWWVEAEFFSDSTFTAIFGGKQQSFNLNLQSGVSTYWTLIFSDEYIVESSYPNFAINNFRAFRYECP